jgi:hypothetical protein
MKTVEYRMIDILEELVSILRITDSIGPQQILFLAKIFTITDFLINFHNYDSNATMISCLCNLEETIKNIIETLKEENIISSDIELLFYRANCEARIIDIFRNTFDNNIIEPWL